MGKPHSQSFSFLIRSSGRLWLRWGKCVPRAWFTGALHKAGPPLPFSPGSCWAPRRPFSQPCTPGAAETGLFCKPRAPTVKVLGRWMLCEIGEEANWGSVCAGLRVSPCVRLSVSAPGAAVGDTGRPPCSSHAAGKEVSPSRGEAGGRGARLRGPGRPLGVSVSPPLAALPDGAGAH